ncbi:hypothetical protein Cgig2_004695 [Carnegiea gigantea]|uniref:Uncharacterized protein n=1 Tax=Carnegiea gigantea TaxID=171969 RepID=A0A9Q1GQI1_9CARY|nr:hypothetical protein Cgig2_004695 [Carnegiea gigantea]
MDLKHFSSEIDIWPVLRTAEFHGTSNIEVLGTGNPNPLLISLSRFSSIPLHPSWANRPWQSRALVLNILELPHDASTAFDSIVLAPLMFSNPPCTMEAYKDPCFGLVVKRKVSLYELFLNKMELLFAIEVATVGEMHGEIDLSCISKAFMQTAFGPRKIFVFLLLWFYLDVKHQ